MKRELIVVVFIALIIFSTGFTSAGIFEDVGNWVEGVWGQISGKSVSESTGIKLVPRGYQIPLESEESICIPSREFCDGKDNDCDNQIDEGLLRQCGSEVGICEKGIQTCSLGTWGACVGSVGSSSEVCDDNLDNNCDGNVDENCGCASETTQSCGSNMGECVSGTQTCFGGTWGTCTGATESTTEICDNLDNDCDGKIDEDFSVGKACSVGLGICQSTGVYVCTIDKKNIECNAIAGTPQEEECGNGIDENCDGIDEDCRSDCKDFDGDGFFAYHEKDCPDGNDCEDVNELINPGVEEVCDDLIDNNCDGLIDSDAENCAVLVIPTHLECVDGACTEVDGEGDDTCVNDTECIKSPEGAVETIPYMTATSSGGGMNPAKIQQAEAALNVKGFDASSALSTGFSDYINPYTGALTINQIDLALPGRNGLGVTIPRGYSSNIFLHINQLPITYEDGSSVEGGYHCEVNTLCEDCSPPSDFGGSGVLDVITGGFNLNEIKGSNPNTGCSPSDAEYSSFTRAKMLGRGWEMTLGKVKTPTPILFRISHDSIPKVLPTYGLISKRGVNSESITLFNSEIGLIYPSSFRQHRDLSNTGVDYNKFMYWNLALAYNEAELAPVTVGEEPNEYVIQKEKFYEKPVSDMVNYYSNLPYSFAPIPEGESFESDIYKWRYNTYDGKTTNGDYTLYTSDISPVHFNYVNERNTNLNGNPGLGIDIDYCALTTVEEGNSFFTHEEMLSPLLCIAYNSGLFGPNVLYKSREGIGYSFENYVPFCNKFDDSKDSYIDYVSGLEVCGHFANEDAGAWTRWAENPYPGTYLTKISDTFGNYIDIKYTKEDNFNDVDNDYTDTEASPFVHSLIDTYGNEIRFHYKNENNVQPGIDSRLSYIEYPSPSNPRVKLYINYLYADECDETIVAENGQIFEINNPPLLRYVYTSETERNPQESLCKPLNAIIGTTTEYIYDSVENSGYLGGYDYRDSTQELIKVKTPTGLIVEYEYAWLKNVPAFDLVDVYSEQSSEITKGYWSRAVIEKKVYNGGSCEGGTIEDGACVWNYNYQAVGSKYNTGITNDDEFCYFGDEDINPGIDSSLTEVSDVCIKSTVTDPFGLKSISKMLPSTIRSIFSTSESSAALPTTSTNSLLGGMNPLITYTCDEWEENEEIETDFNCEDCINSQGAKNWPYIETCGWN